MNRNVMGSWNGICVAWFLLSLVVSVRSFSCCQFSSGLCRTRCEKVSLMTWTQANTAQNGGGEELVAVRDLAAMCPFRLTAFWQCVNSTIANMVRSASWSGRICCEKAESVQCQETCLIAKTKKDLLPGCRRSDEVVLYSCVNKVEESEDCCSNAKTPDCLESCLLAVQSLNTPTAQVRENLTSVCNTRSPRVLSCLMSLLRVDRAIGSHQSSLLSSFANCTLQCDLGSHCCDLNLRCAEECHRLLRNRNLTEQDKIDKLTNICGAVTVHDLMWQCFLKASEVDDIPQELKNKSRKGSISKNPEVAPPVISNSGRSRSTWYALTTKPTQTTSPPKLEPMGLDLAKLQCCEKANSSSCKNLCKKTYWRDWEQTCPEFSSQCLNTPSERTLNQCIEDVESPCLAGCEKLSFCHNFNGRPNLHFRSCNAAADLAARQEYELWMREGKIRIGKKNVALESDWYEFQNDTLSLNIKPVQECLQEHWKALACLLQLKPCHYAVPSLNVCKEDCLLLLESCLLTPHPGTQALCDILAPDSRIQNTCFELTQFAHSRAPEIHQEITVPCHGKVCNTSEVCVLSENTPKCIQGCKLGQLSSVIVPHYTWLRVPSVLVPGKSCSVCLCDKTGQITNCKSAPCVNTQLSCWIGNDKLDHGKTIQVGCNKAICFAGELVFTKKTCQQRKHLMETEILPCNCPSSRSPVCSVQGKYFRNACLARCYGLLETEYSIGPCWNQTKSSGYALLCYNEQCLSKSPKQTRCPAHCRKHQCFTGDIVCGMDGESYPLCVAQELNIPVDYKGYCGNPYRDCPGIQNCPHVIQYDSHCARCGGGFRIFYSQRQLDELAPIFEDHKPFLLTSLRESLQKHVHISSCHVLLYTTMNGELIALFEHRGPNHTATQILACVAESEKIAKSVNSRNPWLTADLSLSAFVRADVISSIGNQNSACSPETYFGLYVISFVLCMNAAQKYAMSGFRTWC